MFGQSINRDFETCQASFNELAFVMPIQESASVRPRLDYRQVLKVIAMLPVIVVTVVVGLALTSCHGQGGEGSFPQPTRQTRIANIHAFARLYGVVRWFHPSDSAASVDWNQLAIRGVARVADVPSEALRDTLADFLRPIAPTVQIAKVGEPFRREVAPRSTLPEPKLVSWEHRGYGDTILTSDDSIFASKRRNCDRKVALPRAPFVALWQAVDAVPLRGAQLRMRAKVRIADNALGQLWMRVERGEAEGFFDNMDDHPVTSPTWATAEITGPVALDATRIVFGVVMDGLGTTWCDDIELSQKMPNGVWSPIGILNGGFEAADPLVSWRPGVGGAKAASIEGWSVSLDHERPAAGMASLRVEPRSKIVTEELFAEQPVAGEATEIDLGSGLRARVPLTLYSQDGRTIGDDPKAAKPSQVELSSTVSTGYDTWAGVADVIVVWNVLQHFWPYWDVLSTDWSAKLDAAIADALDDRSVDDHVATLMRLSASAPDGHASTSCRRQTRLVSPPFSVDQIEGQVVVTATATKTISRGDVIVAVNGQPASSLLAADEARASGSPQWRRVLASLQFGAGPADVPLALRVRRKGVELDASVTREDVLLSDFIHEPIEHYNDGTYYVDLSRASMADIDAAMPQLAAAPGVVFDVRDRPNSTRNVLSHLTMEPIDFEEGMTVAHIIRPDHSLASVPTWEKHAHVMPPLQPQVAGRVAFLTGPRAISATETVMNIVARHRLGEIVGEPTAGTNGDVAGIAEPSGCRTTFTGVRVTGRDGKPYHLTGVLPTIAAKRTIAGVIAGRDEVLEAALAYVRGSSR